MAVAAKDPVQGDIRSCLNLLTPKSVVRHGKVRIGGEHDGGYVMIDSLHPTGGVAYSFGVGPDTSWDVAMAERGWEVFQYDHTVEDAPNKHERCRFHPIGIGATDLDPQLRRLDTIMSANGHTAKGNMLKMDIEGNEFDALGSMPIGYFDIFDQIVMELHGMDHLILDSYRSRFRGLVGNISITHQCVHVHANNYGRSLLTQGIPVPEVIEVTFVKKALHDFFENHETFPSHLDNPNDPDKPDLFLGLFQF